MTPDLKPFKIHLGDEFVFDKDQDHSRRVITNVGNVGDIGISTVVPVKTSTREEYFIVLGSTHEITDIKNITDRWSIDRLVASYKLGLDKRYSILPNLRRKELTEIFKLAL